MPAVTRDTCVCYLSSCLHVYSTRQTLTVTACTQQLIIRHRRRSVQYKLCIQTKPNSRVHILGNFQGLWAAVV